jgi:uncharacterized membrane protein YcgQ (UPF0703/DUF1980 family)
MSSKLAIHTESLTLLQKSNLKSKDTHQHIYYSARKNASRQCCVIVSTVISPPRRYSRGHDPDSFSPDQARQYQSVEYKMERPSSSDSIDSQGPDCQESLSDYAFMMELDDTYEYPG